MNKKILDKIKKKQNRISTNFNLREYDYIPVGKSRDKIIWEYYISKSKSLEEKIKSKQKYITTIQNLQDFGYVSINEKKNEKQVWILREKAMIYSKKYYQEHKERFRERNEKYRKKYKKEIKLYYLNHKLKLKEHNKVYFKTVKGKRVIAKSQAKRRCLDFIELNNQFKGSHAHHINKTEIIYIPREMHNSIYHNVWTGQGMYEINVMAFDFMLNQQLN